MTSFGNDLHLAWRALRRSPWYAAGVLFVLAFGLGATAAVFAVLRSTVLRPLLFQHAGQFVALEAHAPDGSDVSLAPQDIDLWSRRTHTLSAVAYYTSDQVTLSGAGAQQEADSLRTSANLFNTLGTAPALGRTYTAAEQQPGRDHVAILSDTLWRTQFHADPHALGRTLRVNDDFYTISGVMPRGFTFPVSSETDPQLWSPASLLGADRTRDVNSLYSAVGRRLRGVTPAEVTSEINALEAAIAAQAPKHCNNPFAVARIEGVDLRHTFDRDQRTAVLALTGAVGLLWLIVCADSLQASTGRHHGQLQRTLGVTELVLTLCLLVGCGLLLRTVLALRHVPLGFRTDNVYAVAPNLPFSRYRTQDPNLTVRQLLARHLRALPGVDALAVSSVTPLTRRFDVNFMLLPDRKPEQYGNPTPVVAKRRSAGPELQEVLGFLMFEGRFFNAADTATSKPVAVVDRVFAREYTTVTGNDLSHFALGTGARTIHTVAVNDDFHQQGTAETASPEIDLNGLQQLSTDGFYQSTIKAYAEILLRSGRNPKSLLPEFHHALLATNPDLGDVDISSMQQVVDDAMGSQLLATRPLEVLGGLAPRVALTGLVLRSAYALLLTGAVAVLALSLAVTHLLTRFLYGVGSYDVPTFLLATLGLLLAGLAAALLALVALLAALLPAHRAISTNPTEALRTE